MVILQLRQLDVPPGQHLRLHDVSWAEFETILDELGHHRSSRIAYDNGVLEIMVPLPEHEDDKEIIGDFLKALLEELDIEFRTLGSTTFKNQKMLKGIEPDQCFYIQNEAVIRGKKRLDLETDPPPDLDIDDAIAEALKQRAARHGSSVDAEHRKILEQVLLHSKAKSFIDVLKEIPDVGDDEDFERI